MTTDFKREEIKQQILRWMSQEKQWQLVVSMKQEEITRYYYFFCVVIFSKDQNCGVGIEKDVDRVNIMIDATIAENDVSSYKISPPHDKGKFWLDVKASL